MAGTLLEAVARARDKRRRANKAYQAADEAFLNALVQARRMHSWAEIADSAGITRAGVRWRVANLNQARKEANGGAE